MTVRRPHAHRVLARLGRLPRADDDRGSLAMALMAVLVAAVLGALLLPMVVAQNRSTRFDITRVHALNAAQAGVDVAVGQIRNSTKSDSTGDAASLPCYPTSTPLNGGANGTGSGSYSVSVAYWVTTPGTGSAMLCSPGNGTFDQDTGLVTPRFAVITSTGTDGAADRGSRGRTLVSTYVFATNDTDFPGGQISLNQSTSSKTTPLCMEAENSVAGARVVMHACSGATPAPAPQLFLYRSDLSIQLASSVTRASPNGLCLDAPTPHAANGGVVLTLCGVVDPRDCTSINTCSPYNQQWTDTEERHFAGTAANQSDKDSYCFTAPGPADGVAVTLTGCSGGADSTTQAWNLSVGAGSGTAGALSDQLVNYAQPYNCLDVTAGDVNYGYLIVYPCKANPNPYNVGWNQRFKPVPALGVRPTDVLLTTNPGTVYCLMSPMTTGGYVRVTTPCPASAGTPSAYRWTMYRTQDSTGNDLPSSRKFTIVDANGACLAAGPDSDRFSNTYSKVLVATCDGSAGQKWNANASLTASRMINTQEP